MEIEPEWSRVDLEYILYGPQELKS